MAKQTINIGASPNDGTGTPLRTAFDYTNQNFTELYTATGPSGNNIVVPGNATITGALTVGSNAASGGAVRLSNNSAIAYRNAANNANIVALSIDGSNALVLNEGAYTISSTGVGTWSVGGSTAMTLNSTGLGVGVASPDFKFAVNGTQAVPATSGSATDNGSLRIGAPGTGLVIDTGVTAASSVYGWIQARARTDYSSNFNLVLQPNGGNVGIGVTPSAWATTYKALQVSSVAGLSCNSGSAEVLLSNNYFRAASQDQYITTNFATIYQQVSGSHRFYTAPSGTAGNAITFTQAMTLDASGNLLVGTTASGGQNGFCVLRPLSAAVVATTTETAHNFGALTGTTYATFLYATTAIGSITQNGTTGVLYNINSDYRLKESVAPLSGGLARVNALKPSIYKWKSDGSSGEGFLAHELAEVVPAAVTGEKDAVNEDGSIKSQGIDMSRVVPILVAAIQELTARVQTLEAK